MGVARTGATLLAKLERCALDVRPHELLTSLSATRTLAIDKLKLQRPLLLLSDDARRDFPHPELAHEHEHEQKEGDEQSFDGVVVGLAPERMDYAHLNLAFRVLTREQRQTAATATSTSTSTSTAKPPLLATHTARYFQSPDGQLSLGPGGFVRALELASGAQAQVVGKPERAFYELALGTLAAPGANEGGAGIEGEVDWGHVAMVGDDVVQDVGEGVAALGLQRYVRLSGLPRHLCERKLSIQPTFRAGSWSGRASTDQATKIAWRLVASAATTLPPSRASSSRAEASRSTGRTGRSLTDER